MTNLVDPPDTRRTAWMRQVSRPLASLPEVPLRDAADLLSLSRNRPRGGRLNHVKKSGFFLRHCRNRWTAPHVVTCQGAFIEPSGRKAILSQCFLSDSVAGITAPL